MTKTSDHKTKASEGIDRRGFLRGVGLGAGAAGVAAAVGGATSVEAAPVTDDRKTVKYRETEHVLRAYELARF